MAIEPLMLIAWGGQLIAMAFLVWRLAVESRWFALLGVISGAAVGYMPALLVNWKTAFWLGMFIVFAVIASLMVLIVAYAVTRRWIGFAMVLFIFFMFLCAQFSSGSNVVLWTINMLSLGVLLLAPIFCALACREMFGLLDLKFVTRRIA